MLNTRLSQLRIVPNPFAEERVVRVAYDEHGFRNPPDLADWVIAVTGDSFEPGPLPSRSPRSGSG